MMNEMNGVDNWAGGVGGKNESHAKQGNLAKRGEKVAVAEKMACEWEH